MKSQFYITFIVVMIFTLLSPFLLGGVSNFQEYVQTIAFTSFFLALLLLLPGIAMSIPERSRRVGQSILLSSAILLLASFTLCSTGAARLAL